MMKTTRWAMIATILVIASGVGAAEPPTAEKLLAEYEKSVEKLARVRIEWLIQRAEIKRSNGQLWSAENEYAVFRDGDRWKVDRFIRTTRVKNGNRSGTRAREQTLIGDEIIGLTQFYRAPGDQPGTPLVHVERSDRIAEESWVKVGQCQVIFGRLGGDAGYPLWTVMREAGSLERLPQVETVDGVETYVLISKGKYGEHKVWFDPARGGLPRRIEVHKFPGNLFDEEELGTTPAPGTETVPPPRKPGSGPAYQECFCRIEKVQIESKEGAFILVGFEHFSVNTHSTGTKHESRTEFKPRVLEVDPPVFPDNAFRFDIEIPNGTTVHVREPDQDQYSSDYHWEDGKVLPGKGR